MVVYGCGSNRDTSVGAARYSGNRKSRTSRAGFSIIELLVTVAIIGMLMAICSSALGKAMRAAKGIASGEAMHQKQIAKMATEQEKSPDPPTPEDAREAYRQVLDTGKNEAIMTEVLYVIRDDSEFRAYWNTLLNPENTDTPEYASDGSLVAYTKGGNEFQLAPMGDAAELQKGPYVVGWEFLSTVLSETSTGTLGSNVMFSDGHIDFVRYPGEFPVTAAVAKLSHEFVEDFVD